MFKICSIGCGGMAFEAHGQSFRKYAELHPGVELAACCDINVQKAAEFAQEYGFKRHYSDIDAMLDSEKPDAVCLIVPVSLTAELSIQVIEKGYPLIMEKPPGLNREQTMRMISAAEKNNIPTQVAFNRRYMPLIRELKRQLSGFKPEEIQNLRYDLYRAGRKDADFSTTAIHGIDAVRFIAGSDYSYIKFHYQELPLRAKATTNSFFPSGLNVVNIFMDCVMKSGTTAQLSFCPVSGVTIERCAVNSEGHSFFLDLPVWEGLDVPGKLIHVENEKVVYETTGDVISDGDEMFESNGFYGENAAFFDDIRAERKPIGDIRSGLQSVEIADCIRNRADEYKAGGL